MTAMRTVVWGQPGWRRRPDTVYDAAPSGPDTIAPVIRVWVVPVTATMLLMLTGGPVGSRGQLQAQPAGPPAAAVPGAEVITDTRLRRHLSFIASDALEGRLTPSRGLDVAARFLASHLGRLGLRTAGDNGGYLQNIALTRRRLDVEHTTLAVGSRSLEYGEDFLPGELPATAEGPVVYIGNGTVIRSRGVDPYAAIDVAGRIVVSHIGLPTGFSQADLKGPRGQDWDTTEDAAKRRGAIAVLFLPDDGALERWPAARAARQSRQALTVDAFAEPERGAVLPTATLSARGVGRLFTGQQPDPFALPPGLVARLVVAASDERLTTSNVVAVLEGSDPVLKHEYVAIGAHYDHLGTSARPNASGDTIYNGADDDGSGTVAVLAMAEAFAAARVRPKRSILFVWHTGEEQGLWGSRFYMQHPTVPLERIVAQLNIDMIGRSRADDEAAADTPLALTDGRSVYVLGSRRLSTQLGDIVEQVNGRGHGLRLDFSLDAAGDPAQIYERSDHYQYARHGIPVAFFFTGEHEDYHGVDDEIERIDFAKMRRITQLIYATARTIAERPARPLVDGARLTAPPPP